MAEAPRRLSRADSRKLRRYQTALQKAVEAARQGRELDLAGILAAAPGCVTGAMEPDSQTALHSACLAGQANCVKVLLEAGAIVERKCCGLESDRCCVRVFICRCLCRTYARWRDPADRCRSMWKPSMRQPYPWCKR